MRLHIRHLLFMSCFFLTSMIFAQDNDIKGKIVDKSGLTLPGVSIVLGNQAKGTVTDFEGDFVLESVSDGMHELTISSLGYLTQKITVTVPQSQPLTITLAEDSTQLDEIIVTGVFDKRTKMSSSVAISSMNAKDLNRVVAVSAADLLKNTPGVYVNSSAGEVRNTVYSRGISANSNGAITTTGNGYYYVSLQEDGLPVTAISDGLLVTDLFFRNDVTIKRLEAVRGGTSSITSVNAPGGIFNFLSKTGEEDLNELKYRTGLEGDLRNLFNRIEGSYGGSLGDDWSYNVGGFYRYADGARYAGYPLNVGGQIKATAAKKFNSGSFSVNLKYLNDKNGLTQVTPAVGFDDIELAPGINFQDSYLLPEGAIEVPDGRGGFKTFDPADANRSKDFAVGFNFESKLGDDSWHIDNRAKYTNKSYNSATNIASSLLDLSDPVTYGFIGIFDGFTGPPVGSLRFTNRETNENVLTIVPEPLEGGGIRFNNVNSTFSGNSLMYHGSILTDADLVEFMDRLTISKKWENTSINFGAFYAKSKADMEELNAPGLGISLVEDQPQLLDIQFDSPVTGQTYQLTNPEGYIKLGGPFGYRYKEHDVDQLAFFFGNNITLLDKKINIDWGLRFETTTIDGTVDQSTGNPVNAEGGLDGNPLTVYDQYSQILGQNPVDFKKTLNGLSYSAGINYMFNPSNAVYFRYSNGQKAPDLRFYELYTSQAAVDSNEPTNQVISQLELAYKLKTDQVRLVVTPFYSLLSDVTVTVASTDDNSQIYYTPPLKNSVKTLGIELELDWDIDENINLKIGGTYQNAKYKDWRLWDVGGQGKADDKIVDYSGGKAENNPDLMLNITPTYSRDKFYGFLQYKYIGDRPANQRNAYNVPGFGQFDLGLGYDLTKKLNLSVNVNNLTNKFGIMSSLAPGSILQVFNPNNVTKETIAANPDAVHPVIAIQPRALFVTLAYKM